jgi:hypothetical protein
MGFFLRRHQVQTEKSVSTAPISAGLSLVETEMHEKRFRKLPRSSKSLICGKRLRDPPGAAPRRKLDQATRAMFRELWLDKSKPPLWAI